MLIYNATLIGKKHVLPFC